MSEVKEVLRWQLKGFIPGVEGVSKAELKPWVVLASDFDALAQQLAAEKVKTQTLMIELQDKNGALVDLREQLVASQAEVAKLNEAAAFMDNVSQGIEDGLRAQLAARDKLAQPADYEPKPVDDAEAREALASQLCAKLAHDRGAPISWVEAIEIVATITQMPSEEKTKLLAMDDSADQECAHSYANELGCPECGEEFTHPAPAGVVLPSHKDSDIRSPVYGYAKGWNACLDEVKRLNHE